MSWRIPSVIRWHYWEICRAKVIIEENLQSGQPPLNGAARFGYEVAIIHNCYGLAQVHKQPFVNT